MFDVHYMSLPYDCNNYNSNIDIGNSLVFIQLNKLERIYRKISKLLETILEFVYYIYTLTILYKNT